MIDKTDIRYQKALYYEQCARKIIDNLIKRGLNGQYVPDKGEALDVLLNMIPPGAVVARGGSLSIEQIGILPELLKRNQNQVIDPFETWGREEERYKIERDCFFADIYLVGVNAITLDGKLISIDGNGNRVSAMVYGPKKVVCVAGINKIVRDTDEAIEHIRGYVAPLNSRRSIARNRNPKLAELPCVRTGTCVDCRHEWRNCNYTMIIEGAMPQHKGRIHVVLVGEELGI